MGKTPITAGMTGESFINALNNNLGTLKIIISDQPGADYASLNTAIAAIDDIKTFLIDSPISLSADIIFPADITIIIGAQGMLDGPFVLTGNRTTLIFDGTNTAIASNITFAGTWLTEDVDVNNFDVIADGVTDDRIALNKALDFTRLTHRRRIVMMDTYKISDGITVSNVCIVGNPKIIGTTGKSAIGGEGSLGTYYPLSANANLADYSIVCTNATFLASIREGDLLLVSTNTVYGDGYNGGEIIEIVLIDIGTGRIYFKAPLHLDYTTAAGAKVARIEPITFLNIGLITIEFPIDTVGDVNIDRYTAGVRFGLARDVEINVATLKTGGWGCAFINCYRPRLRYRGTQGETAGYGYGVTVAGATMFADISGVALGYRHCVHHGGSTDGVPWESHVHDFYGTVMLATGATAFDTHPSTGSVIFNNCVAQGDSTYSGALAGFTTNGKNVSLINCEARNLGVAALVTDSTCQKTSINGLRCIDVNYGVLVSSYAVIQNLDVKNVRVLNTTLRTGAAISMAAGIVNNLTMSGIHGYNITSLINFTTGGKYPSKLELHNISLINSVDSGSYAIRVNDAAITELLIDGIVVKKANYVLQVLTPISTCIIRNFEIQDTGGVNTFTFSGIVGTLMISNGAIKNPITAGSRIVTCVESITNLAIINTIISGVNMEHFTNVVAGKTFTNFFHSGNIVKDSITGFHAAQTPTNVLTSGSVGIS